MIDTRRSIAALVADLDAPDFNLRARALAELVQQGQAAVPALTATLDNSEGELRFRAARGLAEIADPTSEQRFESLLEDHDERIRAYGAFGLLRLGSPRALDALVRTINDFEDVLRTPDTLSTDGLVALGAAALPRMGLLLSNPDATTRVRAFHVVQQIVSLLGTTVGGPDLRGPGYDPMSEEAEREPAAAKWREWITQLTDE